MEVTGWSAASIADMIERQHRVAGNDQRHGKVDMTSMQHQLQLVSQAYLGNHHEVVRSNEVINKGHELAQVLCAMAGQAGQGRLEAFSAVHSLSQIAQILTPFAA